MRSWIIPRQNAWKLHFNCIGKNESMDLVIHSEFYKEFLAEVPSGRDVEADAEGAGLPDEKIYNVEGEG